MPEEPDIVPPCDGPFGQGERSDVLSQRRPIGKRIGKMHPAGLNFIEHKLVLPDPQPEPVRQSTNGCQKLVHRVVPEGLSPLVRPMVEVHGDGMLVRPSLFPRLTGQPGE